MTAHGGPQGSSEGDTYRGGGPGDQRAQRHVPEAPGVLAHPVRATATTALRAELPATRA